VRDIVPAPHDVEDTAGAAVVDGVCVIIADDARTASLLVPGDYSSNHAPPSAVPVDATQIARSGLAVFAV
jgi:hypothetical protein